MSDYGFRGAFFARNWVFAERTCQLFCYSCGLNVVLVHFVQISPPVSFGNIVFYNFYFITSKL